MVHFYDIILHMDSREVKTLCQSNILAYTALLPINFDTDENLTKRYFMCEKCIEIRKTKQW